jgi:hypothetical protein
MGELKKRFFCISWGEWPLWIFSGLSKMASGQKKRQSAMHSTLRFFNFRREGISFSLRNSETIWEKKIGAFLGG